MSAMTAEAPTRVTRTTTVKTETPAITKPGGFFNWLRGIGRSIRDGWRKFWGGVKYSTHENLHKLNAGRKTAWSRTKRAGRWLADKAFFGGAYLGEKITRGTGYVARSGSWVVRTGLETIFTVSMAAWAVMGLVTMALAWGHDRYEQNVHRHAKAASRGVYRTDRPTPFSAIDAQGTFAHASAVQTERVKEWGTETTTVTEVEEREPYYFTLLPVEEQVEMWKIREPDLPVPEDITMDELRATVFEIKDFTRPKRMKTEEAPDGTRVTPLSLPETEYGQTLTDNEIFQGDSYWEGRHDCASVFDAATREVNMAHNWNDVVSQIKNRMGMAWKARDDAAQERYGKRELIRSQYKSGWDDQLTYGLSWFQRFRDHALTAAQKEEADKPKPAATKKTAKKQPTKKTAAHA